jgi:hypothetical protein
MNAVKIKLIREAMVTIVEIKDREDRILLTLVKNYNE